MFHVTATGMNGSAGLSWMSSTDTMNVPLFAEILFTNPISG